MRPHDLSRRELLLASLAIPMLLPRCAKAETSAVAASYSDGRLHARAGEKSASPIRPTPRPQRLGIGRQRDGFFYVPAQKDPARRASALLYLHGATGSGGHAIQRLLDHANRTGTILIAPDSRAQTWGVVLGDEAEDTAFIDSALEKIFETYAIDPHRIGISGFSDGATAALSTGLVNGDLFSGIAAFSPGFVSTASVPSGRPKIYISHGENDSILPVERCGRRIARELKSLGYTINYHEFEGEHEVPPEIREEGLQWVL